MKHTIPILQSYAADFDANDMHCVSIGRDLNMWSINEQRKLWKCHPLSNPSEVSFSDSGDRIAVKNTIGEIKLIDSANGNILENFSTQRLGEGSNIIWLQNDEYIIDGSWSGYITIRSTRNGQIVWMKEIRNEMVEKLFLNSAKNEVFALINPTTKSDEPNGNRYIVKWLIPFRDSGIVIKPPIDDIGDIAFSPDFLYAAIIHDRKKPVLSIYNLTTNEAVYEIDVSVSGHGNCLGWLKRNNHITVLKNEKIIFIDFVSKMTISEIDVPYACRIVESRKGGYLVICAWGKGIVIQNTF